MPIYLPISWDFTYVLRSRAGDPVSNPLCLVEKDFLKVGYLTAGGVKQEAVIHLLRYWEC